MNNSSFEKILMRLHYKPCDSLKDGAVTNIVLDEATKELSFDVTFPKPPAIKELSEFNNVLKNGLKDMGVCEKAKINYYYEEKILSKDMVASYYNEVLDLLIEKNVTYLALKNYDVEFDENKITITIGEGKEVKFLTPLFEMVEKSFKLLGIDFVLFQIVATSFVLPVSENIALSINEEVNTAARNFEMYGSNSYGNEEVKTENTKIYKPRKIVNKINGKVAKINTIPLTESDMITYYQKYNTSEFVVEGVVSGAEIRTTKNNYQIYSAMLTDDTDSIIIKTFISGKNGYDLDYYEKHCLDGNKLRVYGYAEYDKYSRDVVLKIKELFSEGIVAKENKKDYASEKRVELHAHSKMTYIDSVMDIGDYIDRALSYGHKALALTDKNSVQGLGEFEHALKDRKCLDKIKPIYGLETFMVDEDKFKVAFTDEDIDLEKATYVVFDFETTGLSAFLDDIIEIGACKVQNGDIVSEFQTFVKPKRIITEGITELTSITNDDVRSADPIEIVLPNFKEFCDGCILVAHNAAFDNAHLNRNLKDLGLFTKPYPMIDTMNLAMARYQNKIKKFGLDDVRKYFGVALDHHHRACDDARSTALVFIKMLRDLINDGITNYKDINSTYEYNDCYKYIHPSHITLLAKNREGLVNMNRIISDSHCNHFYRTPRITKKFIEEHRNGLLIGSACSHGDVFEYALRGDMDNLRTSAEFFDYLEVQPVSAYTYLIEKERGDLTIDSFKDAIKRIIQVGKELGKMVVATGDVHELDPEDRVYRKMLYDKPLIGGGIHELSGIENIPSEHFRDTQEMLDEFDFLDEATRYNIVIKNTNKIADMIETYSLFPDKLFAPSDDFMADFGVPSAKDALFDLTYRNARDKYGEELPEIIKKRLDKEINSIVGHGYATIYYIAYCLVKHSRDMGYVVGSRGSVGSSLVATFMGITEVNSLAPHYVCPKCKFSAFKYTKEEIKEFNPSKEELDLQESLQGYDSGLDLPEMKCPHCGEVMDSNGCNIPFETFLGFEGDKVPDIDLNFSGEIQPHAHSYCREIFGVDYTFRGGTIGTIAQRTAENYVTDYYAKRETPIRRCHVIKLTPAILGIKRVTGQHPGGIVVVPKGVDINEITPVQYPADAIGSDWKTTHIDYHKFESNLLKLDILGHDDPTMVRYLMNFVDKNPSEFPFRTVEQIPIGDRKLLKLFNGVDVLGVTPEMIRSDIASNGLPEFGTKLAKDMLSEIRPTSIASLIKISGLSHGTNVWTGTARDYFFGLDGKIKVRFEDLIGCRDDIMVHLIDLGLPAKTAFKIMEDVRKGRSLSPESEKIMRKYGTEEWFIDCCKKIKYLFPKAHATAYVTMALRIAWFKLYKPLYYYSGFFSKRTDAFDVETMMAGYDAILRKVDELQKTDRGDSLDENENPSVDEKPSKFAQGSVRAHKTLIGLQVALEMYARGYKFLKVDINKSDALNFTIEEDGLRIPFVAIDQLGETLATNIVNNRGDNPFTSIKDAAIRGHISPSVMEKLQAVDAFEGLPREDEIGLFRFLDNN